LLKLQIAKGTNC